jgi:hypothetical protein
MDYGQYWDRDDDPSGEYRNYGRATAPQVVLGVATTRREESALYRMADLQGLVPTSEPIDRDFQFPATVYARPKGSARRVLRSRRSTLGDAVNARVNAGLKASGILKVPGTRGSTVEQAVDRAIGRSKLLGIGRRR